MNRIISGLDEIPSSTRMMWVSFENLLGKSGSPHALLHPYSRSRKKHDPGEGPKRQCFRVTRVTFAELAHRLLVGYVTSALVARAIQYLERREVVLFSGRWGFCRTFGGCGPESLQNSVGLVATLYAPDGLIVRHGFSPVSHREVWVYTLCLLEMCLGIFKHMEMERRDTSDEGLLSLGGTRVRKLYAPMAPIRLLRS